MIYGVGIDLLAFTQIRLENEKFIQKILTAKEMAIFSLKTTNEQRLAFFAGRFAAKEACVKALGTGFRDIGFHDIEVLNNEFGQPILNILTDTIVQRLSFHVSISHSVQSATAIVIIEDEREANK